MVDPQQDRGWVLPAFRGGFVGGQPHIEPRELPFFELACSAVDEVDRNTSGVDTEIQRRAVALEVSSSERVVEESPHIVVPRHHKVRNLQRIHPRADLVVELVVPQAQSEIAGQDDHVDAIFPHRIERPLEVIPHVDAVRLGLAKIEVDIAYLSNSHPLSMIVPPLLFNRVRGAYSTQDMSDLLYLDSTMIVVSKQPGQPVHSRSRSIETVVAEWGRKLGSPVQAVHRIDQPVGGVVVLAPNRAAAAALFGLFKERSVERTYLAVVDGAPPADEGEFIDSIATDAPANRSRVADTGKYSRLRYRFIGRTEHHWVLLVALDTGRHHQIRVQLASRDMHVVGDAKYGARRPMRDRSIALHAWRIAIPSPFTADPIVIAAPLPDTPLWSAVGRLLPAEMNLDRVDDRVE